MSKTKLERELNRVRDQLESLRKREKDIEEEIKLAEDAEKQQILERHHISVDELVKMIAEKEAEEKRILEMQRLEKKKQRETTALGHDVQKQEAEA